MLINFAIVLSLLIGFCGLAIDVGILELKKVQLQNAADAAVLGAVHEYERGTTNWKSGGIADAGLNGFTDGADNVTVTISNPPATGSFSNNARAVQAVVTQQVGTTFISSLPKLTAQAVSLLPPPCLMSLLSTDPSVDTLSVTSSSFTATCPMYVGRDIQNPSSTLKAASFSVVGPSTSSSVSGSTQPAPKFNSALQGDPLASIPQPAFSTCQFYGPNPTNVSSLTLGPGTYCNSGLSCSNIQTFTLKPGLYVVHGALGWTNCQNVVSTGGVTIFMTGDSTYPFGAFSVNSSTVSLSAPTVASNPTDASNSSIPGILIFMDRAWSSTGAGTQGVQWLSSTYKGDGIWYSTTTGASFESCQNIIGTNYLGFVMDTLKISSSTVNAPYKNVPAALTGSSGSTGLVE